MRKKTVTFDTIREITLGLPGGGGVVVWCSSVKGRRQAIYSMAWDLNAIVLKTTFDEREAMMEEDPKVYFITDHYLNY